MLLLLPQRYVFSSKSQRPVEETTSIVVVIATTKVRIFKQITTDDNFTIQCSGCYCYHKGTYFQTNHNLQLPQMLLYKVVIATTKVRIFKQITTLPLVVLDKIGLLLLPQRYVFSSKSQLKVYKRGN